MPTEQERITTQHYAQLNAQAQQKFVHEFGTTYGERNHYRVDLGTTLGVFTVGVSIRVFFHSANDGPAELVVNGIGPTPVARVGPEGVVPLVPGDLLRGAPYDLTFNGRQWVLRLERSHNYQEIMTLSPDQLGSGFEVYERGATDHYAVVNKNLVLPGTLAIRYEAARTARLRGRETLFFLPNPLAGLPIESAVRPTRGGTVVWRMDVEGRVTLEGSIRQGERIPVNLSPYLAELPLSIGSLPPPPVEQ